VRSLVLGVWGSSSLGGKWKDLALSYSIGRIRHRKRGNRRGITADYKTVGHRYHLSFTWRQKLKGNSPNRMNKD